MEEKYIKLLLNTCLKVDKAKPLFVSYNKLNKDFVEKLVKYANSLGIKDIYLDERDYYKEHDLLLKLTEEEIKKHNYFNSPIWDEYALKDAHFLMLDSEIPNLMDDVPTKKIAIASYTRRISKPKYVEKQLKGIIPWCIAALPNEVWAKEIFPNVKNPLEKFWDNLGYICKLDKEDPNKEWLNFLKEQNELITKLNKLQIKKLLYKNSLGTNLEIELPEDVLWQCGSTGKYIENLPSYEVFTTPHYKKVNGIVYSSKPLIYNGKTINDFYFEFKDGKVSKCFAKEGQDILEEILKGDEYSSYLGEVALVNYDSPISNSKVIFQSTLLDENAACHLALGSSYPDCIKNGNKLSQDELKKSGLNLSKNHVDFMIGTKDLEITAYTKDGKIIIMKNGNIIL